MDRDKNNAWKWLARARTIDREIEALIGAKQDTRDNLTRITQNYSADGAQSSKDPHKFDRLAELESIIDQKIDELIAVKVEITQAIEKLTNGKHRTVLLNYYVRLMTLEQIAVEMGCSFRNVAYTKKRAVQEIEKILSFH